MMSLPGSASVLRNFHIIVLLLAFLALQSFQLAAAESKRYQHAIPGTSFGDENVFRLNNQHARQPPPHQPQRSAARRLASFETAAGQYPTDNQHSWTDMDVSSIGNTPTPIPSAAPPKSPTLPPNYDFKPPPCIRDESEIIYVNGVMSPAETFLKCLSNVADPYSLPTFYNGSVQAVMTVFNSIQLNNLQSVSILI
jgi:hypothetical protein